MKFAYEDLSDDQFEKLDRPAFCRHPQAIIHGYSRGVYEQQAIHG